MLRGSAVLGMVLTHAARVAPPADESPLTALISWVEPGLSGAFLFLVGWSLTRSWYRASQSETLRGFAFWYGDVLRRAICLYALGVLLFLLQYGPEWPDAVLSPDILSLIAVAVVVVGSVAPRHPVVSLVGALLGLAAADLVDRAGLTLSGVNAGPGGCLPLLGVAFLGAFIGKVCPVPRSLAAFWIVVAAVSLGLVALALPGPTTTQHVSEYTGGQSESSTIEVWFWNHTLKGALLYSSAVLLGFVGVFVLCRASVARLLGPIATLGRHALIVYVVHLLMLGLLDRWLRGRMGAVGPFTLMVMLSVGCLAVLILVESNRGRAVRSAVRRRLGLRI